MMKKTNRYNNPNEFGPWNLILDPNDPVFDDEPTLTTKNLPFSLRTNRTIRLPRIGTTIDPNTTAKKLALNLFKQSLEIPKSIKKLDRPRVTHMNGSLVTRYRNINQKSTRY